MTYIEERRFEVAERRIAVTNDGDEAVEAWDRSARAQRAGNDHVPDQGEGEWLCDGEVGFAFYGAVGVE